MNFHILIEFIQIYFINSNRLPSHDIEYMSLPKSAVMIAIVKLFGHVSVTFSDKFDKKDSFKMNIMNNFNFFLQS